MVKADAYGMGLVPVAGALVEELSPGGPWALGVAAVAEGEALRAAGWKGRVVVFSPTPPEEYGRAASAGLTLALTGVDAVRRWAEAADRAGRRLAFHAEVDTGMGRAGLPWKEAAEWGEGVARAAGSRLLWEGVFTHFHSADEPDLGPTDLQWARFREALAHLPPQHEGDPPRLVHSANSAASLRRAGYGCDLARPGIFLYGGAAGPGTDPRPVASVRARIALVREVPAGSSCGYGATYTSSGPETWGTLSVGYGDGIRRALGPAGGAALVRGVRVPIIGRISMDAVVLNLSRVPGVRAGEVATLIGREGDEEIRVDEVAELCGTISYEVLTGLTSRLPRVYLGRPAGTLQDG